MRIASIFLCYAAPGLFFGAFAASGPVFLAMSDLETGSFGFLLLLMTVGALPAMTVLGNTIHRAPSLALPLCLSAFAVASVLLGQATGLVGLAVGFLAVGAASGALDVALNMRISTIETTTGQAVFNRAHAVFPLAVLVAGPVAGVARDAGVGLAWIYGALAALMLLAAGIEQGVGTRATTHDDTATDDLAPIPFELGPVLVCLGAIAALGAFMEMSVQGWGVIFVESTLDTSATVSGFAITAFMLGLSAGRFAAHLVDGRVTRMDVIRIGAVLAVPAFLAIGLVGTIGTVLAALFLAGMAMGPIEPTVYGLVAARHAPERRGRALSRIAAIAYVGYLTSPVVLGIVAERTGWAAMWASVATIAASVAALTYLARRVERAYGA